MSPRFSRGLALLTVLVAPCAGCRPRLATVSAPPRAAAQSPTTKVQACWIESGRFGPATASALIVRHPDGDLLVDAGNSSHFSDEIAVYPKKDQRFFRRLPGLLKPRTPIDAQLDAVGVPAAGLRWFLPTHAHLDHIGGYMDLPPVPVLLSRPGLAVMAEGRAAVTHVVAPAHAEAVRETAVAIEFTQARYEVFDRHADVFGDGTVVIVPLFGHTPGSVGVFVNFPDGRRIFHIGDAANDRKGVHKGLGRPLLMRKTDIDLEPANSVVALLHALHQQAPEIQFLPAHERAAWKALFDAPNRPCTHGTRPHVRVGTGLERT